MPTHFRRPAAAIAGISAVLAGLTVSGPVPDAGAAEHPGSLVLHTLTVTATNLAGWPDTGDWVVVVNSGNSNILGADMNRASKRFIHGVAKFSVPAGTYRAVGEFGGNNRNRLAISRVAVLPQFTVTRNTSVHMAERSADSKITMRTPQPATARVTGLWLLLSSRKGPPVLLGWLDRDPIWVTPTSRAPTVGTLRAYASQQLTSPAGSGTPYRYVVSYVDPPGIISRQRYPVRPADLATVSERFYQDVRSPDLIAIDGSPRASQAGAVYAVPFKLSLPGRLTVYVGGNITGMTWGGYVWQLGRKGLADSTQSSSYDVVPAGRHITENWNAYPLHPAVNINPDPASSLNGLMPSATREGNTLRLAVTPFSDNQPGHQGPGFGPVRGARITGSYRISQDGRQIAGGQAGAPAGGGVNFVTQAKAGPRPSVISFELDAARTGPAFPLSTATHTVWTWRSAYASGAALPRGWYCYVNGNGVEEDHCAVQPMMTLRYSVARMALDGQVPTGRQVVHLTVGHIPLAHAAPVARVTMSVSFDGGKTWQRSRVTDRAGSYRAVFRAPASAFVMLRTTARDTAGGSVTETITRAYQIAPR